MQNAFSTISKVPTVFQSQNSLTESKISDTQGNLLIEDPVKSKTSYIFPVYNGTEYILHTKIEESKYTELILHQYKAKTQQDKPPNPVALYLMPKGLDGPPLLLCCL